MPSGLPNTGVGIATLRKGATSIGIDGVDELLVNVGKVIDKVKGKRAKEIFIRAAFSFVNEAKAEVPYDEERARRVAKGWISETRHMKDAIFAAYGDSQSSSVLAGVNHNIAPHSHLVEFGGRGGQMPAFGTLRKALAQTRPMMAAVISQGLKELITEQP